MGTRNSIMVQLDGQYRVAQYSQWDGYPSGQGATALTFLRSLKTAAAWAQFRTRVDALTVITDEVLKARWKECGADDSGWVNMEVSKAFEKRWPHLNRDCGAEVLQLIHTGAATEVSLNLDFPKDSLFCEWAYVIDLDKDTFEVYRGFNTRKLGRKQRFYCDGYRDKEEHKNPNGSTYHYYPVRLVKSYPLTNLPTVQEMVEECDPKEKD